MEMFGRPLLALCIVVGAALAPAQIGPPDKRPEPGVPRLVVHEPQGTYRGKHAAEVPVRFDVKHGHAALVGTRVAVIIDGKRYLATNEDPFTLRGLANGPHLIRFELIDHQGQIYPGAGSVVERTINVVRSAPGGVTATPRPTPFVNEFWPGAEVVPTGVTEVSARVPARITPEPVSSNGFTVRPGGYREGPRPGEVSRREGVATVNATRPQANAASSRATPKAAASAQSVPALTPVPDGKTAGETKGASEASPAAVKTPSLATPKPSAARNGSTTSSDEMRSRLQEYRARAAETSPTQTVMIKREAGTTGGLTMQRDGEATASIFSRRKPRTGPDALKIDSAATTATR